MKLALSNSGLRSVSGSVPIVRQQTLPYIVNFQSGGGSTITSLPGISSISGIPTARIGTIKLANTGVSNLQTALQPQQIIVQDPFKSDLQDFKGGLKFELSRNIHPAISGSQGAG